PSVKYMALLYSVLLAILLWSDRAKLLMLLEPTERLEAYRASEAARIVPAARVPLGRTMRMTFYAVAALFLLFVANLIGTGLAAGPETQAEAALRSSLVTQGELRHIRSRYFGLYGVNRTARMEYVAANERDTVRVYAHRATGFTPWRIDSIAGRR